MVAVVHRRLISIEDVWTRMANRFSCHLPAVDRGGTLSWGRHYLPHYYQSEASTLHRWIADVNDNHFQARGQKAVCIGPRGGAKSTVGTLTITLKDICEGLEPYILIASDTEAQAIDHISNLKAELEDNHHGLEDDYPHVCGRGPIWREDYIKTRNGIVVHAFGTGTKIRGRRVRENRPSKIIGDDLENDDHVSSKLERDRVKTWFNRTLMNMGDARTNVFVFGSALHRESLLMELLRRPGWIVRRKSGKPCPFQAIERWPEAMDLWQKWDKIFNNPDNENAEAEARSYFNKNRRDMLRGSELCWPDREPLYDLMTLRAQIGPAAFEAEKQGNPIDPNTCEWPESYFTHDKFWFDEWPKDLLIKGMALDPSKGRGDKRHDFSAFAWGGISQSGIIYVDLDVLKRPVDQIISDALDLHQQFQPFSLAVETNQFQELLADDINEAAEKYGVPVHITPFENFTAKVVRIRRLSTLLSQRRIRFKAGSEGATLAVQQLRDFPNGDHDDGPDAIEMLCRLMFGKLDDEDEEVDKHLAKIMGSFQ